MRFLDVTETLSLSLFLSLSLPFFPRRCPLIDPITLQKNSRCAFFRDSSLRHLSEYYVAHLNDSHRGSDLMGDLQSSRKVSFKYARVRRERDCDRQCNDQKLSNYFHGVRKSVSRHDARRRFSLP